MPLNALMIPTTVPNSPTKGAVEPIVARPLRPRFISACTIATERSRPRLAASITSVSETWAEADWNSDNPVATTLAMWLFLLRSAIEMAHRQGRSEEHTSELQSLAYLVCRLLLEKKKTSQI